ncbi:TIGR02221 family CRISPR-associated protein [uncultured Bacteroides sp.]|jgi:CRISPR-associated protein, TM1812 family|uniref:TIGR02221 family CRISPR-associated protein n=1 Tax=uncultured Bacteroides sp. TaxID=162156 RepID=UPI002605791E|nr:TIGR02221 family CRISPR-associated protein [uncultured Bacteroides sp.]
MNRKVFISVLGTGFYASCRYRKGGFVSSDTRFIQQATLEQLKVKDWRETDTVLFLLTEGAKKNNWNESIEFRKNLKIGQDEPYCGLHTVLKNMSLPCRIQELHIPDGKTEEEMWEIFNLLFDVLQEKDELYIDLTHSFRYLPMLVLVLENYAKFLKDIEVSHISYGNFELRDIEKNEAPMVDLLPLSTLQDWTFAAADFIRNGDVDRLNQLCTKSLNLLMKDAETRKNNPELGLLKGYVKSLQEVTQDMKGCRGIHILEGSNIKTFFEYSQQLGEVVFPPMNPILKKIKDSFEGFVPSSDVKNGYLAAKWCFEHQMYQQALTILHENMISHVCELDQSDCKDESKRNFAKDALRFSFEKTEEKSWNLKTEEEKERMRFLLQQEPVIKLASTFMVTTNLRNDYNHAGMRDSPAKFDSMIKGLGKRIDKAYEMCM